MGWGEQLRAAVVCDGLGWSTWEDWDSLQWSAPSSGLAWTCSRGSSSSERQWEVLKSLDVELLPLALAQNSHETGLNSKGGKADSRP